MIYLTFIALIFSQLLCARWLGNRAPRALVWILVITALAVMHFIALDEPSFLRMVLLCSVLMAGMKWIVYREWASEKRSLTWCRWWMFSALWFGMDPTAFQGSVRKNLEWKSHAITGASCLLVGLLGTAVCYLYHVENILPLFIAMSVGFHFGALRLLTAFWRMIGFPVRTLFRNPLVLRGFRDFWGKRWNLAYSQMMARAVKKPLAPIIGERWSLFAVFLVSGLLHELAITVPVGAGYGLPTLFFIVHGIFATVERRDSLLMALACGALLIAGLPYLFGGQFVQEIIYPCRDSFSILRK